MRQAVAMTIAGSDSGGGAGIQADLRAFAAFGVHGTCAITCLTAQNPNGVRAIQPARASIVLSQIEAVFDELRPHAVKTGMLYSPAIIRTVADFVAGLRRPPPLVVDPVMIATSGSKLILDRAQRQLADRLLPLATVITPNLDEASALLGRCIGEPEELRGAARELQARFGAAVFLKGGHLRGLRQAIDVFYDGKSELLLASPRMRRIATHGTGCTLAAALAACLARGESLARAVEIAKNYITGAIAGSKRVRAHWTLDPFWMFEPGRVGRAAAAPIP